MSPKSPPKPGRKRKESAERQIHYVVEPGTRLDITVEAGPVRDGQVPITVQVTRSDGRRKAPRRNLPRLWERVAALPRRLDGMDLAAWLFLLALAVYLATRLIGLTRYPIYFFTDEAIQTQALVDLARNGYRDAQGTFLPTYFRNGEYHNLGLSVYLQWLPLILFGKSAAVTRATSVLLTLIAAISVGIILREGFRARYAWAGILFLSITPGWFLHSRTAFETAEFTALFAGTLCAYLLYLQRSPRFLYLALFLGACAFYTYSPGQFLVPVTALVLLAVDWRTHWERRRTAALGLVLGVVLLLPYLRFQMNDPDAAVSHLHTLYSYWVGDLPLSEKIRRYLIEYWMGLRPWYWYQPNPRDLARHQMDGYANIMTATLPLAILGLARVLRSLRQPAARAVLVAALVSPVAAALIQTGITRALVFVVPAAILTALGLEGLLAWIEDPAERLREWQALAKPSTRRNLAVASILIGGGILTMVQHETIDRVSTAALASFLAFGVSGWGRVLARWFRPGKRPLWRASRNALALGTFALLSGTNFYLLADALRNGPTWSTDYGLGGMQYGAFQVFDLLRGYKQEHPETAIILTPAWANGTDVLARFFLEEPIPIELGSINGYIAQKFPLDENTLFVMLPEELANARNSGRFEDIRVEQVLPYPDGSPGFHFVRLRYVDHIDEIFAAEKALRQVLQEATVAIDGQDVRVRYSYLESDAIQLVFDGDPYSLAKTYEANPFVMELTFPEPRRLSGFSIIVGSVTARIRLECRESAGAQPVSYTFEGQGTMKQPELSFGLPEPLPVQMLRLEMLDLNSSADSQIHIWELKLR